MKAVVDADTNQILGAAILGIEGGEVMSVLETAMMGKLPYTALRDATYAHPTLSESLNNLFMAMDKASFRIFQRVRLLAERCAKWASAWTFIWSTEPTNCSAIFLRCPSAKDASGQEIGAVRGVLTSVLSMIESGATHVGVATDHVVESFRNDLYAGYKTSEGVPPELLSQFPILEEALQAMGVVVWPMIEFEADDALASAAARPRRMIA